MPAPHAPGTSDYQNTAYARGSLRFGEGGPSVSALLLLSKLSHTYVENMAKSSNAVSSAVIRVTVSTQSAELLEQLAAKGIYGRNAAEVAGRFIDKALQDFVEAPRLSLDPERARR